MLIAFSPQWQRNLSPSLNPIATMRLLDYLNATFYTAADFAALQQSASLTRAVDLLD